MRKKYTIFLGVILLLFGQFFFHGQTYAAPVNCAIDTSKIALDTEEANFLTLINNFRQQNNIQPLATSDTLNQAAAWMAHDMSVSGNLSHTDSLGRSMGTRLPNCGYTGSTMGENIADGSVNAMSTAQQAFTAWENSPPHKANMLNGSFKFIGIAKDFTGTTDYWVTDFGDVQGPPISLPTTGISQSFTRLAFTVFLDGVGKSGDRTYPGSLGNLNPHYPLRTIYISIFDTTGHQVVSPQTVLTYDASAGDFTGSATFTALPLGSYTVKIKADRYLRKTISGIQTLGPGKSVTLPSVSLVVGDINGDNVLDIKDYNILMGCFSDLSAAKNCTPTNKIFADLNDDNQVNQVDYNLLIREISVSTGD